MSNGVVVSGAAAHAAAMNAIKSSGVLVKIEPAEFERIAAKLKEPLVVFSYGGFFSKKFSYLISYKGLAFYCKSPSKIFLPNDAEIIFSKKISIPE